LGAALSRAQIAPALRRGRYVTERTAAIQAALRAPQLQPAPAQAAAMGATVAATTAVIAAMNSQITVREQQLTADFEPHQDAPMVRSLPGLGSIMGARVLGEFGDAPDRDPSATCRKNYAG
jgi:transposase